MTSSCEGTLSRCSVFGSSIASDILEGSMLRDNLPNAKCQCFEVLEPCSPRSYIYRTGMRPNQFLSPNPRIPKSPSLPRGPAAIPIEFAFVWSPGFGSIRGPDKLLTSGVWAYRLSGIISTNTHGPCLSAIVRLTLLHRRE